MFKNVEINYFSRGNSVGFGRFGYRLFLGEFLGMIRSGIIRKILENPRNLKNKKRSNDTPINHRILEVFPK
jgi:hypothetical protein